MALGKTVITFAPVLMNEINEACCGPRHDRRRLCDPWGFGRGACRDCLVRSLAARVLTQFTSPTCPMAAGSGRTVMIGATYGCAIADAGEPAFCKVSHCSKANSTAAQNSCSL